MESYIAPESLVKTVRKLQANILFDLEAKTGLRSASKVKRFSQAEPKSRTQKADTELVTSPRAPISYQVWKKPIFRELLPQSLKPKEPEAILFFFFEAILLRILDGAVLAVRVISNSLPP